MQVDEGGIATEEDGRKRADDGFWGWKRNCGGAGEEELGKSGKRSGTGEETGEVLSMHILLYVLFVMR